jgi:hypothetical protein
MRRRLAAASLIAILSLTAAAATRGEVVQVKDLRVSFGASFTPHALPRARAAPIRVKVAGGIATTDGSHPPALRRLEIALNRNGRLSTRGLPTCTGAELQSTTTEAALALCRPALVGRGRFGASLAFNPATVPNSGRVLVFNSRRSGRPALLLHLYGTVPVRATFVLPLTIEHRRRGNFGTVLTATIPKLAGGVDSVTEIEVTVGREYSFEGRRRSFLSASCAAPAGFPGAVFPFARGSFYFVHGVKAVSTLTRDCHVRR